MKELRPLKSLQAKAAKRKPGYLDACMSLGQLDKSTGLVRFSPEAWMKIRQQFKLDRPRPQFKPTGNAKIPSRRLGLGDAISKVATPIARALGLPCVDKSTGKLKPESGCAKRRDSLNKITLPIST